MRRTTTSIEIIAAEAAEWFTLNREGEPTHEQRERFLAWLSASPLHIEEYLGIAESWAALQSVDDWPDTDLEGEPGAGLDADNVYRMETCAVVAPLRESARTAWRARLLPSAAAALAMLGLVVWFSLLWTAETSYRTELGEQRSVVLEDGSIMQLNAMTRVRVRFDNRSRRIELLDGEAYFKVAHDAARPFDVVTPEAVVRAVGTAFNVYRRDGRLDVAVTEGRVRVTAGASEGKPVMDEPVFLSASEGAVVRDDAGLRRTTGASRAAPAWMQRRLVFRGERLDAVVTEFNRYTRVGLRVEGADLARLRISGTFNADDPGTLVDYLEQVQSVEVDRMGGKITLRKMHDGMLPAMPQQE